MELTSTTTRSPDPSTTAKPGINKALLGGLLFLALFLIVVVGSIIIVFFCYCRRSKGARYKYREDAVEENNKRERERHRGVDRSRHHKEPPRPNAYKNFITTATHSTDGATHSTDGATTGMLSVKHLQRIQARPECDHNDAKDNVRSSARYDNSYEAHYVHNQDDAENNASSRRYDDETIPKRPIEDSPANIRTEKEQLYAVKSTPKSKRHVPLHNEFKQENDDPGDYRERYIDAAGHHELTRKPYNDPDYIPIEQRPAPPIPSCDDASADEQSRDEDSDSFTRTSDHLDSDGEESQATMMSRSGVFQGTWAEKEGPQVHRRRLRLEEDLACESNVLYESTDAGGERDGYDSDTQGEKTEIKPDFHAHGTGSMSKLPEIEALNELDKAVEGHSEEFGLAPITILPPFRLNKLPPLTGNKLPPLDGRAKTIADPLLMDIAKVKEYRRIRPRSSSVSESTEYESTRQRRPSVSDDKHRSVRQRRHSVSGEAGQQEEPRQRHRSGNHTKEKQTRLRTRSSSVSGLDVGGNGPRDVPRSPARQRRSRRDSDSVLRRSQSDRGNRPEIRLKQKTKKDRYRDEETASELETDDNLASTQPIMNRSTRNSSRTRHSSGQPRDSSRSRPDSGKESSKSRPESGKESSRSRPESAKESSRSRPESAKESSRSRPDSGKRHGHRQHTRDKSQETLSEKNEQESIEKGSRQESDSGDDMLNQSTKGKVHKHTSNHKGNSSGENQAKEHRHHSKDRNHSSEDSQRRHHRREDHGDRPHHGEHKQRSGHHHDNRRKNKEERKDDLTMTLHADDELYQLHKKAQSLENTIENGFHSDTLKHTNKSDKLNDSLSRGKKDKSKKHKDRSMESTGSTGYANFAMENEDVFDL